MCVLKARQLGFTWVVLGWALYLMELRRATVLLFSQRDEEAKDLMDRLTGMHRRLPAWLRQDEISASAHSLRLGNGAEAMAFPTTGGRSYTAQLVIVDEADHIPDLGKLMTAAQPAVADGGQIVLLSTADKGRPESPFKAVYRGARSGDNGYLPVFHGWQARPGRTPQWYAEQRRDTFARTGSLDDLHQEYPATDVEALSPRTLDKRLAPAWLEVVYAEKPLLASARGMPSLPGLEVYTVPRNGGRYVVGADPAEGNPQSDDSALEVLDADTGEECACLAGRYEPAVFAAYVDAVGRWYNYAPAMVERNNHGHAVLLWLRDNGGIEMLKGLDDKEGWQTSTLTKARMYDATADAVRGGEVRLHSLATFHQLGSIEGATLRAPDGQKDDRATAFALACAGRARALLGGATGVHVEPRARTRVGSMPRGVFNS